MPVDLDGGCLCGDVRYRTSGQPRLVCICHCTSCRRASGGAVVPWASFPQAAVRIVKGTMVTHGSSPGVTRGHCGRCGTSLTYQRSAHEVDITLASLDNPDALTPVMHIWTEDDPAWLVMNDGLPRYPQGSPPD